METALLDLGGVMLTSMGMGVIMGFCLSLTHFFLKGRRGQAYAGAKVGE